MSVFPKAPFGTDLSAELSVLPAAAARALSSCLQPEQHCRIFSLAFNLLHGAGVPICHKTQLVPLADVHPPPVSPGKGRGRQVIAVARTADVVIMMLDATKGEVQR